MINKNTSALFIGLSAIGLVTGILLIALNYAELPDVIPRHFNTAGEPDGFSKKPVLFVLPAIQLFIFFLFIFLARNPQLSNENIIGSSKLQTRDFRKMSFFLNSINAFIQLLFAHLIYSTIKVGLGQQETLGSATMYFTVALTLYVILYSIYLHRISKRN